MCESQAVLNAENIANELTDRLSTALSGLNELDIERLLSLLKNKYGELKAENEKAILAEIQQQKEQIIAKSGVLEMVKVNEAIDDIGGLEKLKAWLQDQSYIVKNLQAAKEFGVKAPKGTLIAGMPGCGKSLTAKAAAALFQQPLLRLDIGSLLGKYVGESETNMRKALAMAESISPCVLWVDELEKAFVGMTGNNASEVSSRLLGYFLTWLQEKTAPVFIIATANDITALPPELLRKGRFDEIFYVGFPTKKERKKIIEIHLAKAKQQASEFDIDALASECRDYAGADIENAIFDAVKKAFISNNKILTQDLLLEAIRKTTPLRKTLKDKVGEYEKKFDELYLSPSSENDGLSIAQMVKMAKDPNYLTRLNVANDENVTEEILEQLAKDDNLEVRKAVFKNINCPTKVLDEQLSLDEKDKLYDEKFLDIIYQNKNVSFALALDKWKDDDKTRSRIDHLFNNNDISLAENQESIIKRGGHYPKLLLAKHQSISEKSAKYLVHKGNVEIRKNLASNEFLSEEIFNILVEDSQVEIRTILAKNPSISESIIQTLAKDSEVSVRKTLSENQKASNEVVQLIQAQDGSAEVKAALARNPNLVFDAAKILAKCGVAISMQLAQNPNIAPEIEEILAKTGNYTAAKILAGKVNLSNGAALALLERDYSSNTTSVRKTLAQNFSLSEEVIQLLAKKGGEAVQIILADRAVRSSELENILVNTANSKVGKILAHKGTLSESAAMALATYAFNNSNEIREILANNPKISDSVMQVLAKQGGVNAQKALASRSDISLEVEALLAKHGDHRVAQELVKKANLSDSAAQIIAALNFSPKIKMELANNFKISETVMELLSNNKAFDVRNALANNLSISDVIARKLATDSDKKIRMTLVRNPNISSQVIELLSKDNDEEIRRIAEARIKN